MGHIYRPRYISIKEAAERLRISQVTALDWINRGKMKADRVQYQGFRKVYEIPEEEVVRLSNVLHPVLGEE